MTTVTEAMFGAPIIATEVVKRWALLRAEWEKLPPEAWFAPLPKPDLLEITRDIARGKE